VAVVVSELSVVLPQLLASPDPVELVRVRLGRLVRPCSTPLVVAVAPRQAERPVPVVLPVLVVLVVAHPLTVVLPQLTVPAVVVPVVSSPAPVALVSLVSWLLGGDCRSPTPVRIL
jgi:hypothetical protein